MLFRLWKFLFGWDYIQWKNSADSGVARVMADGNGKVFYFRYKSTKVVDVIKDKDQVLWLTCSPDRYLDT